VRLAGCAADVDAVRVRPADDGKAAGPRVAAARRAGVAEQGEADAAVRDVAGELPWRDELAALAVGEDQHRAALVCDELAGLGGGARGELAARAGGAQVGGEGVDAGLRHCAGAPGVLGVVDDGGDRGGGGDGEDGGEDGGADCFAAPRCERHAGAEAGGDGRIHTGEVARSEVRHRAGDREAGDQP
jgi:hypothetical protein